MTRVAMKNMHLPLPESVYDRLRVEAQRTGRPATGESCMAPPAAARLGFRRGGHDARAPRLAAAPTTRDSTSQVLYAGA